MLRDIELKQFRSYLDDSFEFSEGVNIIVGPNASGKSNLLEAILLICRGFSYRASDEEMITFHKAWARLDATMSDTTRRTIKITHSNEKTNKSYIFDDKPFVRLTHPHSVPVVLFEPNDLMLLHGQPDMRRAYLDDLLEQLDPAYSAVRKHYRRILSQRNALLKRQPRDIEQQIFVWNVRLSELGGHIARARIGLVEKLNQSLKDLYHSIAQATTVVTADYVSALPFENYETVLLHKLESSLEKDMLRGFTAVGPHRDDLVLCFDNVTASSTASRGETRTALLSLKIFELQLLETVRGKKPLLLLDDVFSELDGKRRHALTDHLKNYQTFITTTDADIVGKKITESANVIAITP